MHLIPCRYCSNFKSLSAALWQMSGLLAAHRKQSLPTCTSLLDEQSCHGECHIRIKSVNQASSNRIFLVKHYCLRLDTMDSWRLRVHDAVAGDLCFVERTLQNRLPSLYHPISLACLSVHIFLAAKKIQLFNLGSTLQHASDGVLPWRAPAPC